MQWKLYGRNSVLLTFADAAGPTALARSRALSEFLERQPPPSLVEYVPAFTTMLLEFETSAFEESRIPELVHKLESALRTEPAPGPLREIRVIYDGPDLRRVAEAHQLTEREVCELHSARIYDVYILGFSPGFPYLGELDRRLHTPRLSSPRLRVPAGSVAIGGSHTGIYSIETPGGWNIIGHTSTRLFDSAQTDPRNMFLLTPGDRVRFVPESQ